VLKTVFMFAAQALQLFVSLLAFKAAVRVALVEEWAASTYKVAHKVEAKAAATVGLSL
jgi:hypothetical protein